MVTIDVNIHAPIKIVWDFWTQPQHIKFWCTASNEWYVPDVEVDLIIGGKFKTVMAAKDGSASFDFDGVYKNIIEHELIEYQISDGRKVSIEFTTKNDFVNISETFQLENINSEEVQRGGWQAILNNFKKYVEQYN